MAIAVQVGTHCASASAPESSPTGDADHSLVPKSSLAPDGGMTKSSRGRPLDLSSSSTDTTDTTTTYPLVISGSIIGWFIINFFVYILTFGIPHRYIRWYKSQSRTKTTAQGNERVEVGQWYRSCLGRPPPAKDTSTDNSHSEGNNTPRDWSGLGEQFAMTWIIVNGISTVFIGFGATLLQVDGITSWEVSRTTTLLGLLFAFSSFICGCVNYLHRNNLQSKWEARASSNSLEAQQKHNHPESLLFWILITLPTSLVIWSIIHLIGSILLYSVFTPSPTPSNPPPIMHSIIPPVITLVLTILLSIVYALVLGRQKNFESEERHFAG
ncbi:hypothetical protein BDN72DRAFT_884241 [Pluteus cervinus]|uniref:Uncharacterized protein n=1 Tax=Pluteus cervinus TaxID=181527 RepID=A0ACD2ZYA0_9AGAR|nr:hypothetical protein BDN72DRAFT_884241 [Pluteus cervinus]